MVENLGVGGISPEGRILGVQIENIRRRDSVGEKQLLDLAQKICFPDAP